VPTKTVLKLGFLERDHLADKSNRTKMGQKINCALMQSNVGFDWGQSLLKKSLVVSFSSLIFVFSLQMIGGILDSAPGPVSLWPYIAQDCGFDTQRYTPFFLPPLSLPIIDGYFEVT
jgi:hypothetical protein